VPVLEPTRSEQEVILESKGRGDEGMSGMKLLAASKYRSEESV
jgi:hypothetical protein